MAYSYATLEQEACWRAQVVPPALEGLGAGLRAHYGVGRDRIGSPGDNRHLRGGHRSRRWIRESAYCTNRTYTVTYPADREGDEDWYAAIDIDPNDRAELIAMCRRLDEAVRAGLLEEISEWYGNVNGDLVVDGWNNIADRIASSDPGHLSHLHITFLRKYANDAALMGRLLAVLIGDDDAMKLYRVQGRPEVWAYDGPGRRHVPDEATLARVKTATGATVTLLASQTDLDLIAPLPRSAVDAALAARLDAILAAALDDGDTTVVLDPAALAEVQAIREAVAAVPQATADLVHADLAD